MNGQPKENGNIWYTRVTRRKQTKHNTTHVGHHYAQINTNSNNVNNA